MTEIWDVDLEAQGPDWERYSSLLEENERAKAWKFVSMELRQRYAVTRGVLRILAGRKLNRAPEDIRFEYSAHGKPSIAHGSNIFINVSHSGNRAAIAFSSAEVGVDIERVRSFSEPMNLVRRFFSVQERAVFEGVRSEDQEALFFRCWTRKEAFVKALGGGLSVGLDTFTVPMLADCSDRPLVQDPRTSGRWWRFLPLELEDGYVGTVVVDPTAEDINQRQWLGLDPYSSATIRQAQNS